jgi:hypothetical protein
MSTQHNESDSDAPSTATSQTLAEGYYTGVNVTSIQHGSGSLRSGTGTLSAIGVFSCGAFGKDDLPEIGKYYNITGNPGLNLPGWVCVHNGLTSDFKAKM